MTGASDERLAIAPPGLANFDAAAALALGQDTASAETRSAVEGILGGEPGGELLAATRGQRLVGAALVQLQPGDVALLCFPELCGDEPAETATQLLTAAADWANQRKASLIQCLLPRPTAEQRQSLGSAGFECLGNLFYLLSLADAFPAESPAGPLDFEPYSEAKARRLGAIVEATYRETLDCPRLNGLRSIEDVMAGYRAAGAYDPSRWYLVRQGRRDVGCVLLADYPAQQNVELLYMGLLPEVRGSGWGLIVTRWAQWVARSLGRERLVLAVDGGNRPALAMYEAAGFRAWDYRTAFLKLLGAAAPSR